MSDKEKALEAWRKADKTAPRAVEHWFYFPTKETMDLFAINAIDMDLRVVDSWQSKHEGFSWGLLLTKVGTIDPDQIEDYYETYSALAKRFNGEYDGYGSILEPDNALDKTLHGDNDIPNS